MITAAKINKMVGDYLETDSGRKYVKNEIESNKKIQSVINKNYDEAVRILARLIYAHAPLSIRGSLDPGILINWASKPIDSDDGKIININFQKSLLRRPSLSNKKKDVDDIVRLFIKGWKPKHFNEDGTPKRVFGKWRDHGLTPGQAQGYSSANVGETYIMNRVEKKADNFIVEAVDEFMTVYAKEYGVTECIIDKDYIAD